MDNKYYRFTINNIGVYEWCKQNLTKEQWMEIRNSSSWLPRPEVYTENIKCESYFTKTGYDQFKKTTLPIIYKYTNEKVVYKQYTINKEIIYEDKYQIVINIKSRPMNEETLLEEENIMSEKILPCFTPKEMKELGVFGDAETNHYHVKTSNKNLDNWELYQATGYVVDDYLTRVREAYENMVNNPGLETKQELLELGWNPEVTLSSQSIGLVRTLTESKLASDGYLLEFVDLTKE